MRRAHRGIRRGRRIARLGVTGLACGCLAAVACEETAIAPQQTLELQLVGADTFWIQDTEVNPGCHYEWIMRATGDVSARAELLGGHIFNSWDLNLAPVDTMYRWDEETIRPLFGGSAEFRAGQQRQSGPYATTSRGLPSFRMRVEFDYIVTPGRSEHVVSQDMYCLRN